MALNILHGGNVRYSAVIDSAETTEWLAGRVLSLDAQGEVVLSTSGTTEIIGLAMKDRTSSTATSTDSLVQAPSGEEAALLLDDAVVEDDQVSGNSTWAPGDAVYASVDGKLSSANTRNRVIGKALLPFAVGATTLTWFFDVQY